MELNQSYRSPNHDSRSHAIDMILLHYTGMPSAEEALKHLCSPISKVSAHYLLREDGTGYALVDEDRRAWHAGVASWHGEADINGCSIGIELANPGHDLDYQEFPEAQMIALEMLVGDITRRYDISASRVVGHSDVAPYRKRDPGELFDWQRLAKKRLAVWPEVVSPNRLQSIVPGSFGQDIASVQHSLACVGYQLAIDGRFGDETAIVVKAFQRRFRPKHVNGILDGETVSLIYAVAEMHSDA